MTDLEFSVAAGAGPGLGGPLPPAGFIGRHAELAAMTAAAASVMATTAGTPPTVPVSTAPVIAITGMGGVGKTALAVHWARSAATDWLYVDLHGFGPAQPTAPADALAELLRGLGVRDVQMPPGLNARATLFRSLSAGRRILVVLDNARDSTQLRPLLPGPLTVVTSRNPTTPGAPTVQLGPLHPADALDLLAARIGRDRVDAEPTAARRLTEACGRLPLALGILAARAATRRTIRLTALANELQDATTLDAFAILDAFASDRDGADLRTALSWSYKALAPDAARLFRRLALPRPGEITVTIAAAVAGEPDVRPLLRDLAAANLISERHPGRYAMHPLLRAYARELDLAARDTEDRSAAIRRLHARARGDELNRAGSPVCS